MDLSLLYLNSDESKFGFSVTKLIGAGSCNKATCLSVQSLFSTQMTTMIGKTSKMITTAALPPYSLRVKPESLSVMMTTMHEKRCEPERYVEEVIKHI